jgi:hypothetical protein
MLDRDYPPTGSEPRSAEGERVARIVRDGRSVNGSFDPDGRKRQAVIQLADLRN